MFKNSKLLKGITLVFALVLLIGCGVVLSNVAAASPRTVVMYVGDPGDNTSGLNESTALHSLDAAIQKANEMKLPSGSELKLIVVDRLTITTKGCDSTLAFDASGFRLPITITSLETTNEDQFSDLYLAYFDGSATSGNQSAVFYNDITFKDVGITVKVQQDRVGFVATAKRWMQKNLHFIGNITTFDHCVIKPERTGDDVDSVICYADYSTNNAYIEYDKVVNIKNGDYTTAAWFLHNYRVPYETLTVNMENATFGSLHVAPMTSTATTQDLKKFTVNLGAGTTVTNLYMSRQGHIDIPEGITINYYDGCNVVTQVACTSASDDSGAAMASDVTHNVYGGNITLLIAGSRGPSKGNVTLNMYGGTIGTYYGGGNYATSKVTGVVTNNIYGGTIGTFYGGGHGGCAVTKVINNVTGGEITAKYCGGGRDVNVSESVVNNVSDIAIKGSYFGGGEDVTIGSVVNNLKNVSITKEFYGGSSTGTITGIENNLENVKLAAEFYGGSTSNATIGTIVNNISGDHENGGRYYGANCTATADVTGSVTNNIFSGHFKGAGNYLGNRKGNMTGSIINNISGGVFDNTVFGGIRGEGVESLAQGDIITTITGGEFKADFCNGNAEATDTSQRRGNMTATITGGVIHGSFYGGHNDASRLYGNITNTMTGGIIYGDFVGGNKADGTIRGSVNTTLNGGTIYGTVNGVNGVEGVGGDSYLHIQPKSDAQSLILYGVIPTNSKLKTYFYGGEAPLLIGSAFNANSVNFSTDESLTVSQIENWVPDHTYVQLKFAGNGNRLVPLNGNSNVTGSGAFDGLILKGSAMPAGSTEVAPGLTTMVSFHVSDSLGVRFWVEKTAVEAYLQAKGNWSYSVTLLGNEVANASITSIDQIPAADIRKDKNDVEYVTFTAGISVPASQFNEEITVVLGGVNSTSHTVFKLLENGVDQYEAANMPAYAQLLKTVHNYGTQAFRVFGDGEGMNQYTAPYTGTYTTVPTFTKIRGYRFKDISLSLDEKIAMNFYADFNTDVTFKAVVEGTNEELDPSKIVVKKVEGADGYNTIVTLKLDADEINNVYVLSAMIGDEVVATCTNSIAYSCALYQQEGIHVELIDSILAYLEAVKAVVA